MPKCKYGYWLAYKKCFLLGPCNSEALARNSVLHKFCSLYVILLASDLWWRGGGEYGSLTGLLTEAESHESEGPSAIGNLRLSVGLLPKCFGSSGMI